MAKYTIDIDNYIGSWLASKYHVKEKLANAGSAQVTVRVNSLGGRLDDGLDIAAQFEAHGNVTCELFSLNASAATVLTLGAKKVRMHSSAFYLIHKPMVWIDTWGNMNEDDIDKTIADLQKQKNNTASFTLVLAKMYAIKSSKSVTDILNLMKEEKWLNAQEAKDWGFVDEVFTEGSASPVNVDPGLINAAGLPPFTSRPENNTQDSMVAQLLSGLKDGLKDFFQPTNKTPSEMKKDFKSVNTILNVEGIELKNGKAEITEEQLKLLNDALDKATSDKEAAEQLAAERETTINDLNEQIETLNNADGDDTGSVSKDTDEAGEGKNDDFSATVKNAKALYNLFADE